MKIINIEKFIKINENHKKMDIITSFYNLCLEYRHKLFDEQFAKEHFLNTKSFFNFLQKYRKNIFLIMTKDSCVLMGFIFLYNIKHSINAYFDSKITFCVARPYWGYASYTLAKKSLEFVFKNLNLRKITFEVIGKNTLARSLIKRLKFNLEGVLKDECVCANEFRDLYIYTKFNPAFKTCG